jgi:hypothetical protein
MMRVRFVRWAIAKSSGERRGRRKELWMMELGINVRRDVGWCGIEGFVNGVN